MRKETGGPSPDEKLSREELLRQKKAARQERTEELARIDIFDESNMTSEVYIAVLDSHHFRCYGERRLKNLKNRFNVQEEFRNALSHKKIILMSQAKMFPPASLRAHFSPEYIDGAIQSLELVIQNRLTEESNRPYFEYCLGALKRGLIPMDKSRWEMTPPRHLMRWFVDRGGGGGFSRTAGEEMNSWTDCAGNSPVATDPAYDADGPTHDAYSEFHQIVLTDAEREKLKEDFKESLGIKTDDTKNTDNGTDEVSDENTDPEKS